MKITILRKMAYEETFIYVLQFEYVFQYLFSWNNEVYQEHVIATPPLWKRLLWRLGRLETPYDKDTQDQLEKIILSGAMKSIDALKIMKENGDATVSKGTDNLNKGFVAKPLPNEA